jgi:hypothetical protein
VSGLVPKTHTGNPKFAKLVSELACISYRTDMMSSDVTESTHMV